MTKRKTASTRHLEAECLTTNTFNTSLNDAILRGLRENLQEDKVKSVHFGGLDKHAFCTQESTNSCSITLLFRVINVDVSSTSRRVTYVTTSHLRHGVYFI